MLIFKLLGSFSLHGWITSTGSIWVDLLPNWIGIFLLLIGVKELRERSDRFLQAKKWCIGLIVYYGLPLVSMLVENTMILHIIPALATIYIIYCTVEGIGEMENETRENLMYGSLKKVWVINTVCEIASYVLRTTDYSVATFIVAVIFYITAIVFLFILNKTRKEYNQMLKDELL